MNAELSEIYSSFRAGNKDEALEWLSRILDSGVRSSQVALNDEEALLVATLSWERRSLADCVLHASIYVERNFEASESNNFAYAYYIMALAKRELGDPEAAIELLLKASQLCPKRQVIYLEWANLALKQKDATAAKTIIESGLEKAD